MQVIRLNGGCELGEIGGLGGLDVLGHEQFVIGNTDQMTTQ